MKKSLKLLFCIMALLISNAIYAQEDLLQIAPANLKINNNGKIQVIELQLNNTIDYSAFSFKMQLPKGLSLGTNSSGKPFGSLLNIKRYVYKENYDEIEETTTKICSHSAFYNVEDDGTINIGVAPNLDFLGNATGEDVEIPNIQGRSGTVLKIYVKVDESIEPGIYPIYIYEAAMTAYNGEYNYSVRPEKVTSYVIVGDYVAGDKLDLSSWTNYIPKDVIGGLGTWLATQPQVKEIDLSNVDDSGQGLPVVNPNTILYAKEKSNFAVTQEVQMNKNVVEGDICKKFYLTDGAPLSISKPFTARTAKYTRSIPAKGWYSLCLPFNAVTPEGISVERYVSLDESAETITFEKGSIEADHPCIFNADKAMEVEFTATDVAIAATSNVLSEGPFIGTYQENEAGSITGCYALRSDGSGFGKTDNTASVSPFRAYIDAGKISANVLRIIHDGEETGVEGVLLDNGVNIKVVNDGIIIRAGKKPVAEGLYSVDGRKITEVVLQSGETKEVKLPAGVYVINNVKFKIG